ncbi:THAP domain-containing protein 1-like [Ornithodoros turicata]|uniref:THAP domain-containing protein 1-like n=1 Tax=Ornithodoros turicata TaxID=34597 RepID=UPI003138E0E9
MNFLFSGFPCETPASMVVETRTALSFPRDESLGLQWVNAIGRPVWVPTKYSRVCSKHFRNEDFDRTSLTRVRLREGSVPVAHPSVQVHQQEHDLPARREPSGQEPIGVCTPEPGTQEQIHVSLPEPDTQEEIEVSMPGSDTQEPMDVGLLEPKTPERTHVDGTTSTPVVSAVGINSSGFTTKPPTTTSM